MNAITSLGLLVLLVAVLPGIPGDFVYRSLVGVSWREKELQFILRLLAFSMFGLAGYALVAARSGMPSPDYIVPETFTNGAFTAATVPLLAGAYLGHLATATVVGLVASLGTIALRKLAGTGQRDAWDQLVHNILRKPRSRWIVVHLQSGEDYTGYVESADVAVEPDGRDIILKEPYRWDESAATYQPTGNQFMFLKGTELTSVAVVYEPDLDSRVVPVTEVPFAKKEACARETVST